MTHLLTQPLSVANASASRPAVQHRLTQYPRSPAPIRFCGSVRKAPAPQVAINSAVFTLSSPSGRPLSIRQWWPLNGQRPAANAKGNAILLVPGYGGRTGWGAPLADRLLADHPLIYGLNLSAIDADPSKRTPFKGTDDLKNEITEAIETLSQTHQGKITLVATSIGGLLTASIAAQNNPAIQKLVLIAPAFRPSLKFINPFTAIASLWHMGLKMVGLRKKAHFQMAGAESDLGTTREKTTGEKKHHGVAITPGLLWSYLKASYMGGIYQDLGKIKVPTLIFLAGQDNMCSAKAVRKGFNLVPANHKKLIELPAARHNLVKDDDIIDVSNAIADWLGNHS